MFGGAEWVPVMNIVAGYLLAVLAMLLVAKLARRSKRVNERETERSRPPETEM